VVVGHFFLFDMGIPGLLPILKDISNPISLNQLSGQTVAVDGYSWLHKGAFSCALELVTSTTTK
jgi:exonuclease-1